jgi:hypothetical protein
LKKKPWWIADYYIKPPDKYLGEINNYNYGAFSVTLCPDCKMPWEYDTVGKKRIPVYYNDFPSYKLEENTCPQCTAGNNIKRKDNK